MKIDISNKLSEIERYKEKCEEWKKNHLVWNPFHKDLLFRLSWNSNSLEGNTLSLEETIQVIEYDEVRSGHTFTEYQEAKTMYAALSQKMTFKGNTKIDLQWIKDTNYLIMQKDGEFRKEDVYIGTPVEVVYYPPKYQKVPELMKRYTEDLPIPETIQEKDVIAHVARKHIEFERIHPFKDGNGRTGRVIMHQQLLNQGILPAIIKDQSKYRQAFRRYDKNGETSLMEYVIAEGILETYHRLENVYEKFLCRDTNEIIKCNSYVEEPKLIEEQSMKQCMERTATRMPERKLDKKLDR
ncbi:Fic family protein [Dorea sp. ICN-14282]|uniref:Fic family protein n=1 Tax=Dorea sp. ICN-14282 TaxID=3134654 RepID=UPI0030C3CB21